jgi:hypothetical protein
MHTADPSPPPTDPRSTTARSPGRSSGRLCVRVPARCGEVVAPALSWGFGCSERPNRRSEESELATRCFRECTCGRYDYELHLRTNSLRHLHTRSLQPDQLDEPDHRTSSGRVKSWSSSRTNWTIWGTNWLRKVQLRRQSVRSPRQRRSMCDIGYLRTPLSPCPRSSPFAPRVPLILSAAP